MRAPTQGVVAGLEKRPFDGIWSLDVDKLDGAEGSPR